MAELATIARPYAEALFKAAGGDGAKLKDQIAALSVLASDEGLRQFAESPKVEPTQVFDLVAGVASYALELFGAGVYRQPLRLLKSVGPVALIFVIWDAIAIAGHVWTYNPRYITGLHLPFAVPIEEVLFFIVIPICGLLTYSAVSTILGWLRR